VSGPNGEGLPTHILVTDEMVKRALDAYDLMTQDIEADEGDEAPEVEERSMRAALSEVAPGLFSAGMRAAIKMGPEEQSGTDTEDGDASREVGPGGWYLGADGEVQPSETEED
jgi:hypothetical protein